MNCREVQGELSAYVDGELRPGVRAEVEAHVKACRDCQDRLAEVRKLATGVAALPKQPPPAEFLNEVRRKIARGEEPRDLSWQEILFGASWVRVLLGAAAAIAAVVLLMDLSRPLWQRRSEMAMAKVEESAVSSDQKVFNKATLELPSRESPPKSVVRRSGAADELQEFDLAADKRGEEMAKTMAQAEQPVVPGLRIATPSGVLPTNESGLLVVSNDVTLVYLNEPAAETIVAEADDPAEVETRVDSLATLLRGKIVGQDNTKPDLQRFYISLPVENVETFKTQFAAAELLTKQRRNQENARSLKIASVAAQAKAAQTPKQSVVILKGQTGSFRLGTGEQADVKSVAKPGTAVLEIQVVPPKN